MISLIISTYKPELFGAVVSNIQKTIGVEHEIIKINNPGTMSLSRAYNFGAEQAKYDHLLFVHDDVIFQTENWGSILCRYLMENTSGIIGIAGSDYVPSAPSGWFVQKQNSENTKHPAQAFAVDGVFMAVSKNHFKEIKFNENIGGYHGYDLDFSLRMAQKYQNFIIKDIRLEHLSAGKIDQTYLKNNMQIRNALGSSFQKYRDAKLEKLAFVNFLNLYFKYHPVNAENLMTTLQYLPMKKFSSSNILVFVKKYLSIMKNRNQFNLSNG